MGWTRSEPSQRPLPWVGMKDVWGMRGVGAGPGQCHDGGHCPG